MYTMEDAVEGKPFPSQMLTEVSTDVLVAVTSMLAAHVEQMENAIEQLSDRIANVHLAKPVLEILERNMAKLHQGQESHKADLFRYRSELARRYGWSE